MEALLQGSNFTLTNQGQSNQDQYYTYAGNVDDFDIAKPALGSGGQGTVYKATRRDDRKVFALKLIEMTMFQDEYMVDKEIQAFKALNQKVHKKGTGREAIVEYFGAWKSKDGSEAYILMEYCNGGDLNTWLIKSQTKADSLDKFRQIAKGVSFMHGINHVHRDLKPGNIFLSNNNIKVGDYGITKVMDIARQAAASQPGTANTLIGTPGYWSPEIKEKKKYNFKTDIFSLGIILAELLCPKDSYGRQQLREKIRPKSSSARGNLTDFQPDEADLLGKMLAYDPQARPDTAAVLAHPLLR